MSKVILSAALSQARKSIGGLTFSKGPFGPVILTRTRPTQSESNAQLGIRQGFQTLSKRWATVLTQAQQAAWIALAVANPIHDSLGQVITLTGVQFYVRLNSALKSAQQPIIDVAPGALSAGAPGSLVVVAQSAGPPTLTVNPNVQPGANDTPIIWSMHPIRIGQVAVTKKLSIISVQPPGTNGPWDVLAPWNEKWGIFLTSAVIAIKVQYTDSTTGFQGTPALHAEVAT